MSITISDFESHPIPSPKQFPFTIQTVKAITSSKDYEVLFTKINRETGQKETTTWTGGSNSLGAQFFDGEPSALIVGADDDLTATIIPANSAMPLIDVDIAY